ncbi:MAG: RHS repeat-associated core domain-containing protein [Rhizomicrobium sp.]
MAVYAGTACGGTLSSTTTYLNDPASGAMSEQLVAGGTTTWHDYLKVGGAILGERFYTVGGATSWKYFVLDHLGSVAVMTDDAGGVAERLSYDAWGRRRNSDGTDNAACSITSTTTRGYTGHEMLDSICEINANARIYDPTLGRFMSPDSTIPDPFNGQSFNRYSYVMNNPLSMTDPSGLVDQSPKVSPKHWIDLCGHGVCGTGSLIAGGCSSCDIRPEWIQVADKPVTSASPSGAPGDVGQYSNSGSSSVGIGSTASGDDTDGGCVAEIECAVVTAQRNTNKAGSQFGNYGPWTYGSSGPFVWKMANYRGVEGRIGEGLVVNFKGSGQVQWKQNYRIQSPYGDTGWQHDGDYPYYDSSNSLDLPSSTFWDTPTLGAGTGLDNVDWSAQDQVIDLATGRVIYTFTWGFSTDANGMITPKAPEFSK